MKRNFLKVFAAVCVIGIISGCGSTIEQTDKTTAPVAEVTTTEEITTAEETTTLETTTKEVTTEAGTTTAETTTETVEAPAEAELMTIGSDSLGYMEIPADWISYFDPSTYGMNSVQYSSPDVQSIITMVSYDKTLVENGLVSEEQLSSFDPYTLATASYTLMADSGYQSVEAATVTLGGHTSYQVYGYVESNGANIMLVAWYFAGDDGYTRYICFEAPMEISLDVCAYIENSYRL